MWGHEVGWADVDAALAELSDLDYQRRVWLHPTPELVGTLVEAIERLFDDSALGRAVERGTSGLDAESIALLDTLDRQLRAVDQDQAYATMVESEEMDRVRVAAAQVRRALGDRWAEGPSTS